MMKPYWHPMRPMSLPIVERKSGTPPSRPTMNQPVVRFGMSALQQELMNAVENGCAEQCRKLLSQDLTNANMRDDEEWTPLARAAINGHCEIVDILLDHGANINGRAATGQATALMWAAAYGQTQVILKLLESGADLEAQLHDGRTAREVAMENDEYIALDILNRPSQFRPGWPFPPRQPKIKAVPFRDAIHGILAKLDQRLRERSAVTV